VIPKELDIQPRYDQREIDAGYSNNEFQPIVAPMGTDGVVNINQDAYFSIANIDADTTIVCKKSNSLNGVYFFLIKGKLNIGNNSLSERDGLGITEEENIEITSQEKSSLLCMEVPMKL
jgi:redox-sensitive bicupin YhaK (pirin superfamily)